MRGVKIAAFEPLVVGFVCNECVYAAADLAGTSRFSYPENVRLIRVPCSGQVDMIHILRAFENGADGVFVGGCLKDQCHYVHGNYKAEDRVRILREIMGAMGLEEERLSIHFLSAAMAREFVNAATDFTKKIKELGPSPLKKGRLRPKEHGEKRAMLRSSLMAMSKALKAEDTSLVLKIPGFGKVIADGEECIGCTSCAFLCNDGAMTVEVKKDKVLINNTYWKCTACGKCAEFCPTECIDISEEFDLARFLEGKTDKMASVGLLHCTRCSKPFLPLLLSSELERILENRSYAETNLRLCPSCRKFDVAERVKATRGLAGARG